MSGSFKFVRSFVLILVTLLVTITTSEHSWARPRKHHPFFDPARAAIEEALVKTPQDQEVCFSPEERCDIKLIKFVKSAKISVDVAIFDINLDALVHELLVASKRIPVRILVDRRQAKGDHSLVPLLIKAGGNVRYGRQRGIMHNKFVTVDGQMVETGSFNHTHHASYANNENMIYLANPKVVERFKKRFEQLWAQATPPDSSD